MKGNILETMFESSISRLSLIFRNQEEEAKFQETMRRSRHLPLVFRIYSYLIIGVHVGYRVLALFSALTTNFVKTGTYIEEMACLLLLLGALALEGVIKLCKQAQCFQGTVLYAALPVMSILASFSTQRAPTFGLAYFLPFHRLEQP